MKPKRPFQLPSTLATVFAAAMLAHFAAPAASAATLTWNGGYATTGSWQNAANWGGTAWANANDVVFGSVNLNGRIATFLSGGKTVKSLTFQAGSPAYSVRLATSGNGGSGSILTFISGNTGLTVEAGDNSNHNIGISDGSVALLGNLLVTHNGGGTLTFSRPVSGSGFGLTKAGSGLLVLAATNTYSGATTLNDDGELRATVGGSGANSEVILNSAAATFSINVTDNTKTWTCAALTAAAAGTLEFNFGAVTPSAGLTPLTVTGLADFSAATPPVSVNINAGLTPGVYPLITWNSTSGTAPATGDLTLSQVADGTSAELSVTGNSLNLVINGTSPTSIKADNSEPLNLGLSWVGNVVPGEGDMAKWDATVTAANTTNLGADLTWAGIIIENPGGPVTINGTDTLGLGAAPLDIDMAAATADLTLNCPLVLTGGHLWSVAEGRTLTINGEISGPFPVAKLGAGTAVLSGLNLHTGTTSVLDGTLRLGADDTLPFGAGFGNVVVDSTLDLNGLSQTLNGLSGTGIVDNTAAATNSTLTVGANNAGGTFDGILRNSGDAATLNLVKTGSGTFVLGGVNILTGSVTLSGGTLAFANTAPFNDISGISMAGGTTLRPNVVNGVIPAPITVGATDTNITINAPSIAGAGGTNPVPVTLSGGISGDGNVRLVGIEPSNAYGHIYLNAPSDYAGTTLLTTTGTGSNIFVRLGANNALPATTVLTLDGGNGSGSGRFCDLNLNGRNQTLAGLTNVTGRTSRIQRIRNTSGTPATLTVNNASDYTYTAQLGTGGTNLGLTKSGAGILTLSGSNTYAGDTTVSEGTLVLGGANPNNDPSTVTIAAGAKLRLAYAGADTVAALVINGTPQAAGVYGHTDSGANNGNQGVGFFDAYFEPGTGTITILAGYAAWAADNAGGQDPDLDWDHDGVPNGVEFFMNAAPGFTANPALDGSNTITWPNGGNIPASAYGSQFVIQTSGDLAEWTPVPLGNLTTNTDGPGGSLAYTLTGPAPRFVRLKVTPE